MRPDGTRVKGLSAVVQALPYVMPKRYDAQNMTTETADEDIIRKYIREKRREGRGVTHMSLLIAAYYRAFLQHPKVNYFIMNSKIYKRNHFCVSFVMLKTRADGTPDETVLKIFLEPADDIFSITEKIRAAIDRNAQREHNNATDRFVNVAFSVPGPCLAHLPGGLPHGPAGHPAPEDHRPEPLPHQPFHHQPGLHQDPVHLSPLL